MLGARHRNASIRLCFACHYNCIHLYLKFQPLAVFGKVIKTKQSFNDVDINRRKLYAIVNELTGHAEDAGGDDDDDDADKLHSCHCCSRSKSQHSEGAQYSTH